MRLSNYKAKIIHVRYRKRCVFQRPKDEFFDNVRSVQLPVMCTYYTFYIPTLLRRSKIIVPINYYTSIIYPGPGYGYI